MSSRDEFYIGWQPEAPPGFARRVSSLVGLLLATAGLVALLVSSAQSPFISSSFDFLDEREFEGIVALDPYPTLRVRRPGADAGWSRYLLVAPGKHGARELVGEFDARTVRLSGTLVHHDGRTMIEVTPGSVAGVADFTQPASGPLAQSLGEHTVVGEIADSKCHLGVMNPGSHKVHRACATLCIRGGIPPILLVDGPDGTVEKLLLVDRQGRAVNEAVLPMVADRVEITGELVREDDLLILRADPATYSRVDG